MIISLIEQSLIFYRFPLINCAGIIDFRQVPTEAADLVEEEMTLLQDSLCAFIL